MRNFTRRKVLHINVRSKLSNIKIKIVQKDQVKAWNCLPLDDHERKIHDDLLIFAIRFADLDVIKFMVREGFASSLALSLDDEDRDLSPLEVACRYDRPLEIIKFLVEDMKADVNFDKGWCAREALKGVGARLIPYLCEQGLLVDYDLVKAAAFSEQWEVIGLMIQSVSDVEPILKTSEEVLLSLVTKDEVLSRLHTLLEQYYFKSLNISAQENHKTFSRL